MSSEDSAAPPPKRNSVRQHAGNALKIIVSAGLMVYLFSQIDLDETAGAILGANPWWLLAAFALFEFTFVLRALRWKALIRGWGASVPIKDLVVWYLVGSFFNSVLPTGFGGDVLRVYELSRQVDDPVLAANSVVVDRYLGLMVLLAMGLLALPLGAGYVSQQVVLILVGLFVAGLAGGVLVLNQRWWRLASQRIPVVGRILAGKLSGLSETASRYSARSLAEATLVSLYLQRHTDWLQCVARLCPRHTHSIALFRDLHSHHIRGADAPLGGGIGRARNQLCYAFPYGGRAGAGGRVVVAIGLRQYTGYRAYWRGHLSPQWRPRLLDPTREDAHRSVRSAASFQSGTRKLRSVRSNRFSDSRRAEARTTNPGVVCVYSPGTTP